MNFNIMDKLISGMGQNSGFDHTTNNNNNDDNNNNSSSSTSAHLIEQELKRRLNIGDTETINHSNPVSPSPAVISPSQLSSSFSFSSRGTTHGEGSDTLHSAPISPISSPTSPVQSQEFITNIPTPSPRYAGTPLKGTNVVHTVRREGQAKLNVTPITKYNTDSSRYLFGKQIATNDTYMAYGIRDGHIRVINKRSAKRTLLKGHKQPITDLKFMRDNVDYLASTSMDRTIIIWEIMNKKKSSIDSAGAQKEEEVVGFGVVLYIKPFDQSSTRYFKQVVWHPTKDSELIAVTSLNEIVVINLQVLRSTDRICKFSTDLKGVTTLQPASDVIVNMVDISTDGHYLAAGFEDGSVKFWSGENYTLLKKWDAFQSRPERTDRSVYSINFFGSHVLRPVFNYVIIGGPNNAEFILAKLEKDDEAGLDVHTVQTVTLQSPDPMRYGLLNHVELDTTSSFLLVANSLDPALYVLHLEEHGRGDFMFDYITEFGTDEPVLSFDTMTKITDPEKKNMIIGLFCIQPKTMQLLHVSNDQCYPLSIDMSEEEEEDEEEEEGTGVDEEERDEVFSTDEEEEKQIQENLTAGEEDVEQSQEQDIDLVQVEMPGDQFEQSQEAQKQDVADITPRPQVSLPDASSNDLLAQIQTMLDTSTERQYQRMMKRFEAEMLERDKQDQIRQKNLLKILIDTVTVGVPGHIDQIMTNTVNDTLVPAVVSSVNQMVQKEFPTMMQTAVREATNRSLERLHKSMAKTIESQLKQIVTDDLEKSIRKPINESFQKVLKSTIIPSFEQSCQKMFEQIGRAFDQGMEERVRQPMEGFLAQVNNDVVQTLDKYVQEAVQSSFGAAANVQASSTATGKKSAKPTPKKVQVNPRDEVMKLVQQKRYEDAFAKALSLENLNFVTWLCKQIDPDVIVSMEPMPLSQAIVLSLMQQLAFDLENDTDLKLNWLNNIALVFDPSDPRIQSHVPEVLNQVLANLAQQYDKHVNSKSMPMALRFKPLMLIVSSQLKNATH